MKQLFILLFFIVLNLFLLIRYTKGKENQAILVNSLNKESEILTNLFIEFFSIECEEVIPSKEIVISSIKINYKIFLKFIIDAGIYYIIYENFIRVINLFKNKQNN